MRALIYATVLASSVLLGFQGVSANAGNQQTDESWTQPTERVLTCNSRKERHCSDSGNEWCCPKEDQCIKDGSGKGGCRQIDRNRKKKRKPGRGPAIGQ